jgi:DnaJ like chaperone protein
MGFWKKIAGLAARRPDGAECDQCPPGLPGEDPAFSTAVTALGAKLARADGRGDQDEYQAFLEVFQPEAGSERNVQMLYDLASQSTHGYESYAKRLARRYRACPRLLEDVLDGLFHIAAADGVVTPDESAYLERVSHLFGLSSSTYRRVKATHLGEAAEDPYSVLDLLPEATDAEVRAARRRLMADCHPDMVRARGLPEEFVEVFNAKAVALNQAYEQIFRERKLRIGLDAAGAPA